MPLYILGFYIFGAIAVGFGFHFLRRLLRYNRFPSTDCILLFKRVVSGNGFDGGGAHFPEVSFTYIVDGKSYSSSRLCSLGDFGMGGASPSPVEHAISDLQAGSAVRVFYDPANPSFAFIRNGLL